ncbi:MAG: hypothetical protein IAF58_07185 [Leptolyngbya sp.]|nr:hypothetical protein [Candidatus Melainabacteria bacterium]
MRKALGRWVYGCDVCQDVCPYNQRPPAALWEEFSADKGVGHYLSLLSMFDLKTDEEFRARFEKSPVRRPKLRGLTRNALVVIGNILRDSSAGHGETEEACHSAIERVFAFIDGKPEDMLLEHAYWALAQYDSSEVQKRLLNKLDANVSSEVKELASLYLN